MTDSKKEIPDDLNRELMEKLIDATEGKATLSGFMFGCFIGGVVVWLICLKVLG